MKRYKSVLKETINLNRAFVAKDGSVKAVKNLGWLVKNWRVIDRVEYADLPGSGMVDTLVIAWLRPNIGDGFFVTPWASKDIMLDWFKRPVFKGIQIDAISYEQATETLNNYGVPL